MPRNSATCSIAFCGSQPPACSCARHNSGITAEACRPGGYLAICFSAHVRFSAVKENSFGCKCGSARRRLAILSQSSGELAGERHDHVTVGTAAVAVVRHAHEDVLCALAEEDRQTTW